MRILTQLEKTDEIDACDCAVVDIDRKTLTELGAMAKVLMAVHELRPDVYKIDFWGHNVEVYPYTLIEALPEEWDQDTQKQILLPGDFQIDDRFEAQRLECRVIEIIQPDRWGDANLAEVQFSCMVKHTSVLLRTFPMTVAVIEVLWAHFYKELWHA